ncbi:hypothetical protein NG895_20640 [Aeoliella sp. ICT_H6.2]|uniref:Squalene cyclase N-terminal domain-containing protein n=1 Tax=Aeoliella straminimaris TaxID=2954799 RepID=A0A9X2FCZ3_9BACT|nr:hypothetical protein [Aeoliella straminimaris]MCO6046314.1 hypothetical protein [Aeoliella straminimaris]
MFTTNQSAVAAKSGSAERPSFRVATALGAKALPAPSDWLQEWNGRVVSTAVAVGALVLSEQHGGQLGDITQPADIDSAYQGDLSELIVSSMHWLARRQRNDGGWTSHAPELNYPSDLMTSMIVRAAFQLTGAPAAYAELGTRMDNFIKKQGGVEKLKLQLGPLHSGTLLARGASALAEVVDWRQLPSIPIESANFETTNSRVEFWTGREPVLPAIVALGLASFHLNKPVNPITYWRRSRAASRAIDWLNQTQLDDGSFSRSVPVTGMVLMSLASIGQTKHPIVRRGVEYLFAEVRGDGSWPDAS